MSEIIPRLLTPEQAAAYLALGSRWAVYRLVAAGELVALKVAGKLRVDVRDLDALVELKKGRSVAQAPARRPIAMRARTHLAPLSARARRNGDTTVTPVTEARTFSGRNRRAPDVQSVALPAGESR